MKVLFLANIPSPYRVDFFNELGKYCDLTVIYERITADDRDRKWEWDNAQNYKEFFLKGINIGVDSAICLDIVKWLKPNKFDLIIVGGYSTPTGMLAIQTLKLRKIPFILNCDGGFIKNDKKIIYKIKRYFISNATWWLSTGNEASKYLSYYGANENNIFIYPFSSLKDKDIIKTAISKKTKKNIRSELNIVDEYVAISVGRYIKSKGYDTLIKSWRNIDKNYKLLIIGSGEEEEALKQLIEENYLSNIELIGFKKKEELRKYYLAADFFILPTRSDVWGLVINEAMACGLPIITTDKCIAGKELIDNYINGFVIPVDDEEILAEKADYLFKNENIVISMANENLKRVSLYTIEEMAKSHIRIFEQILEVNK